MHRQQEKGAYNKRPFLM